MESMGNDGSRKTAWVEMGRVDARFIVLPNGSRSGLNGVIPGRLTVRTLEYHHVSPWATSLQVSAARRIFLFGGKDFKEV